MPCRRAFDGVEFVRVLHVLGAVLWAGGAVFSLLFVGPAVRAAGEAGQKFMQAVQRRGGPARIMGPVSGVTILTGLILYGQRGYWKDPWASGPTAALTAGSVLGLAVFVAGLAYGLPLQKRMARLASHVGSTGPTPEQGAAMARLGKRLMTFGTTTTWLLVLALVLMVGRNLFA